MRTAPLNDNFVDAATIAGTQGVVSATTAGATKEPAEPRHDGDRADTSVWFRWTAPADGRIGFTTGGEALLVVYTGSSLATLTAKEGGRAVAFEAQAGTTYFLAADYGRGSFGLMWERPPPNDDVQNAPTLSGLRGEARGTNVAASRERQGGAASVWFRWRAPITRRMVMTTIGSNFDTVLRVYTGARIGTLSFVASDDDGGPGLTSVVRFRASGGRVYRIAVAGYEADDMGQIRLAWRPAPARPSASPRLTGSSA